MDVTASGTDGQMLLGATGADPAFATITSTGGSLTFIFGPHSINIEVASADIEFITVPQGGTGRTVLTTFGVLLGEGSNNVNVTAAGTNGQLLVASTTGDPAFSTVSSTGGTLAFTVGPNSINIDINAPGFTYMTPWTVPYGGTGHTVLTKFGVLIGEGSNNVDVTAAGTNGQLLVASTTGDPAFSTVSSTGGTLAFTVGPNSINIDINAPGFTFMTPWTVPYGGTGHTVLTKFGVLLGEGSNNIDVTAAGTNGQLLVASTTGDPAFSTVSSTGGTLAFTVGPNSINIDINAPGFTYMTPWTVPFGGTGHTVLTTFGVLVGEGSNNVHVTSAGTDGQMLLAATGGDPAFATLTSSGGTVTFTFGPNSINIDVSSADIEFITVPQGGTGRTVLTTFGVLLGEGSNNIDVTAAGTNGQLLIASTGADPAFATLASSSGTIAFTQGSNSLSIDVVGGGIPWIYTTSNTSLMNDTGYIASSATSSVALVLTLPLTASVGTVIRVNGIATGGWQIATNPSASGQVINFGDVPSSSSTPLASTQIGDSVELLCTQANLTWFVLSAQGNLLVT